VGQDADPEGAARILTDGALRYNGQTCTSINGAIVHPARYGAVRERLRGRWAGICAGPLFDEAQARACAQRIAQSGGSLVCGGRRAGNHLEATLVESPCPDSALVREGVFGPCLWIAPGDADEFAARWERSNRYPLCAAVLSASADPAAWAARLPNLARLTLNGDMSIEHIFEPWGGYGGSGTNPVASWEEKYQRVVQLDEPAPPAGRPQ
jgi:acyl-CoA reductase-like NAD-dependent aldehyde dehydrogenase